MWVDYNYKSVDDGSQKFVSCIIKIIYIRKYKVVPSCSFRVL